MAWTEQCKLVFKSNADALIWKQKGRKNKTAVIRQLGKDTGIPFKTLERWYYEKENENILKNEGTPPTNGNDTKNGTNKGSDGSELPICKKCEKNTVEVISKTGKPVGPESKYYGLCGSCRKRARAKKTPKKAPKFSWDDAIKKMSEVSLLIRKYGSNFNELPEKTKIRFLHEYSALANVRMEKLPGQIIDKKGDIIQFK